MVTKLRGDFAVILSVLEINTYRSCLTPGKKINHINLMFLMVSRCDCKTHVTEKSSANKF